MPNPFENYWSTHASDTRDVADIIASTRYFGHRILDCLPEDKQSKILDIGCGTGDLVACLHAAGYVGAKGIDTSPEMIEIGRKYGVSGIEVGDAFGFFENKTNESLDVIVLSHVLEHFSVDAAQELLAVIRRALKPTGRLIVLVPNAGSPLGMPFVFGDITHKIYFTGTSLAQIAKLGGWKVVEIAGIRPAPNGLRGLIKRAIWMLERRLFWSLLGRPKLAHGVHYEQEIRGVFDPNKEMD